MILNNACRKNLETFYNVTATKKEILSCIVACTSHQAWNKNSLAKILRSTFIKLQESITEVESPEQAAVEWLFSLWLWSQDGSDIKVAVTCWWSVQQVTQTHTVCQPSYMNGVNAESILHCRHDHNTDNNEQNDIWSPMLAAWFAKIISGPEKRPGNWNMQRSKRLLDNQSILITLFSQFWGIKSSWSNLDEAQLWDSDPGSFHILLRSVIGCMIAVSLQPQFINPSSFQRSFSLAGLNGWRAWKKKSRERGHVECQTICLAIPDSDPGNTDARLSGETQTSNED